MPSYAALLGHQPMISLAELAAATTNFKLEYHTGKGFTVFHCDDELDTDFINTLGGTVILARQVSDKALGLRDVPTVLEAELAKAKRGKVTFSYRCSGLPARTVKDLYRLSKDRLKNAGRPSRYVGSEKKAAPAVVLHENDMLGGKQACELTLLHDADHGLWIGRTIGAQDIDAYSKRDIEKPVRDTRIGLLPPKLAQVLLNLGLWAAQSSGNKAALKKKPVITVYDPFCGTGVIPMEALLRGWPVLASDVSQKAVNDCTKNIDWLRKEEKILKKDVPTTIWKHDATKPFDEKLVPDVIVTETSLGPNINKKPTLKEVDKMQRDNDALQSDFLRQAHAAYPKAALVMTWPVWNHSKGSTHVEKAWATVSELGYSAVLPLEQSSNETSHNTLLYRRPGQFVGREIVILLPGS